ncbi:MAG: hypothetical protein LW595_00345 [Rickettsiales bacterium]|nr:hypothetical protein [Rickettsiales bacterium]
MPHIIIEHSFSLDNKLKEVLASSIIEIFANQKEGNFDADQCKIRFDSFDRYLVGYLNQDKADFIHLTVKIMDGRLQEIKNKLAIDISSFLQEFFSDLIKINKIKNKSRCDISVDIVDMNKFSYQKYRFN